MCVLILQVFEYCIVILFGCLKEFYLDTFISYVNSSAKSSLLVQISARNSKCLICTISFMEGPYCGLVEEAPNTLRIRGKWC